jgi:hypothetical protein
LLLLPLKEREKECDCERPPEDELNDGEEGSSLPAPPPPPSPLLNSSSSSPSCRWLLSSSETVSRGDSAMLRNCEAEADDEGATQVAAAGDAQGEEATGGDDATRMRGEDADITSLLLLALPLSEGSTRAVRPRDPNRKIAGEEEPAAGEPAVVVACTIGESSMAASSVDDFLLTIAAVVVVVVAIGPRHPSLMAAAAAAAFVPDVRALMACGRSVVAEEAEGGNEDMARN